MASTTPEKCTEYELPSAKKQGFQAVSRKVDILYVLVGICLIVSSAMVAMEAFRHHEMKELRRMVNQCITKDKLHFEQDDGLNNEDISDLKNSRLKKRSIDGPVQQQVRDKKSGVLINYADS